MTHSKLPMVLSLAVALSVPAAFADTAPISWDQFVAQCKDPKGSKDKQFEPEDIKIECAVVSREFVEELPGAYDLPALEVVSASVISNKLSVPAERFEVAKSGRAGECVRYKEIERTATFTSALSCDSVLKIANGDHGKKNGDMIPDPRNTGKPHPIPTKTVVPTPWKAGSPAEFCVAEFKDKKKKGHWNKDRNGKGDDRGGGDNKGGKNGGGHGPDAELVKDTGVVRNSCPADARYPDPRNDDDDDNGKGKKT